MSDLETLRDQWIAADQAVYDAWLAAKALLKRVRTLRKKAKTAKQRFIDAHDAGLKNNESTQHAYHHPRAE